jgi:hypothetical protein
VCVQLVAPDDVTEENLLNVKKEKKNRMGSSSSKPTGKSLMFICGPLIFLPLYIYSLLRCGKTTSMEIPSPTMMMTQPLKKKKKKKKKKMMMMMICIRRKL